jgi:hypothetical protein
MNDAIPVVPLWLNHLPTVGGLVVPWVTARTPDGRHLFGAVDQARMIQALTARLCGVCGRSLIDRASTPMVILARLSDVVDACTAEPALHPQCAHYTITACPMVGGRMAHYRATPVGAARAIDTPVDSARLGAPAEPWFSVWVRDYRVITHHGGLAASFADVPVLRVRSITWRYLSG